MKKFFTVALLAGVAVAMVSCASEQTVGVSGGTGDNAVVSSDDYTVKGWVRIRLDDDAGELRVGEFTRGAAETGNPELDKVAAKLGATEVRRVFGTDPRFTARHRRYGLHLWYDIKIDESISVTRAGDELLHVPGVAHVQPIYKVQRVEPVAANESNCPPDVEYTGSKREMPFDDPGLPWQWHYDNDGSITNSVAGADIGLFEGWKTLGYGDPSVIVSVHDGGVEYTHEDLRNNMWVNTGEIPGNGIDDDGNGVVDDIYGANFSGRSVTGEIEFDTHGTHVAGTIAAENNNGKGVCGVAGGSGIGDGVRIMSAQIFKPQDNGAMLLIADSYRYAADNGAVISQNSWNYKTEAEIPKDVAVALDYFMDNAGMADTDGDGINDVQTGPMAGGVVIFSGGNDASTHINPPSSYPRVVVVTSMMPNYKKAGYSNYGKDFDIFAPGGAGSGDYDFGTEGGVYSTDIDNKYSYKFGTSMACPHVSGIAALIVSHYGAGQPGFTADQLREKLLTSYRNVAHYQNSATIGQGIGRGLIDASMVTGLEKPGAPNAPVAVSVATRGERRMTLTVEVPADGNGMAVAGFEVLYAPKGTAEGAAEWKTVNVNNSYGVDESVTYDFDGLGFEITYVFKVYSVDRFGTVSQTAAECEGTTVAHENLPPETVKPLARVDLSDEAKTATLNLNDYFTDPDIDEFGDALTFAAESQDTEIVTVALEGAVLTITGVKTGETIVSVTATDKAGASISKNMAVRVNITVDPPTPPVEKPIIEEGKMAFYYAADTSVLNVVIGGAEAGEATVAVYDAASRKVMYTTVSLDEKGCGEIGMDGLSAGIYSAVVSYGGTDYRGNFVRK